MSAYENVVGGKLKLKGKALDVKAGGIKKKKKPKHRHDQDSLVEGDKQPEGGSSRLSDDNNEDINEDEKLGDEGHASACDDQLTPAEKRYIEQRERIDMRRLAKTVIEFKILTNIWQISVSITIFLKWVLVNSKLQRVKLALWFPDFILIFIVLSFCYICLVEFLKRISEIKVGMLYSIVSLLEYLYYYRMRMLLYILKSNLPWFLQVLHRVVFRAADH